VSVHTLTSVMSLLRGSNGCKEARVMLFEISVNTS
jgi:hypothetical protein